MKMKYKGSRKGTRFAEIARADGVREIARMEELIRQMAGQEERKFTISDGKMLVEVKDVADYEAFKVNYLQMKRAAIVATRERLDPKRKTRDYWAIMQRWGGQWEEVCAEDTLTEARQREKEYRLNQRDVPVMIKRRRERIA